VFRAFHVFNSTGVVVVVTKKVLKKIKIKKQTVMGEIRDLRQKN